MALSPFILLRHKRRIPGNLGSVLASSSSRLRRISRPWSSVCFNPYELLALMVSLHRLCWGNVATFVFLEFNLHFWRSAAFKFSLSLFLADKAVDGLVMAMGLL